MALASKDCKDLWDFPVSSSGGRRNSGLGLEEAPGLAGTWYTGLKLNWEDGVAAGRSRTGVQCAPCCQDVP